MKSNKHEKWHPELRAEKTNNVRMSMLNLYDTEKAKNNE